MAISLALGCLYQAAQLSATELPLKVADLPRGFAQQTVAAGFTGATGMEIAPVRMEMCQACQGAFSVDFIILGLGPQNGSPLR